MCAVCAVRCFFALVFSVAVGGRWRPLLFFARTVCMCALCEAKKKRGINAIIIASGARGGALVRECNSWSEPYDQW